VVQSYPAGSLHAAVYVAIDVNAAVDENRYSEVSLTSCSQRLVQSLKDATFTSNQSVFSMKWLQFSNGNILATFESKA
jgi:hypothetical protein